MSVLVCGGGLDSFAVAALRRDDIDLLLFVDYGQIAAYPEMKAVRYLGKHLGKPVSMVSVTLPWRFRKRCPMVQDDSLFVDSHMDVVSGDSWKWLVPHRNAMLASFGMMLDATTKRPGTIFVGFDPLVRSECNDSSNAMCAALKHVYSVSSGVSCAVEAPLVSKDKKDIVNIIRNSDLDVFYSWSCYNAVATKDDAEYVPCGICRPCMIRRSTFRALGVIDPGRYARKDEFYEYVKEGWDELPAWVKLYFNLLEA